MPREEAPGSVVAVVTLEVGGPGWGALRTQGWGGVPEGGSRLAASSAEFKAMRVGGAESGGNNRGAGLPNLKMAPHLDPQLPLQSLPHPQLWGPGPTGAEKRQGDC